MDRVSYYYSDLGLNFEQELIDLIELTNPAA
jgi:hypothetical protein